MGVVEGVQVGTQAEGISAPPLTGCSLTCVYSFEMGDRRANGYDQYVSSLALFIFIIC